MGFIADSIRIAKDGSVTSVAEPTTSVTTAKKIWTAKMVCAELHMVAHLDLVQAKCHMNALLTDHNFDHLNIRALENWIDQNWGIIDYRVKGWCLMEFFQARCP